MDNELLFIMDVLTFTGLSQPIYNIWNILETSFKLLTIYGTNGHTINCTI